LQDFVLEAIMRSAEPLPDLGGLLRRPTWQRDAACRGEGVTEFFPADGSSPGAVARICARCGVADECLAYALDNPSLKGIWAGTSERGRRRMRAAAG
jgi:WhiB family transcriptional regulator, redox-sensing transcriptional regulator